MKTKNSMRFLEWVKTLHQKKLGRIIENSPPRCILIKVETKKKYHDIKISSKKCRTLTKYFLILKNERFTTPTEKKD